MNKNEIHVIYGSKPISMVKELLDKIKIANEIHAEMRIALKPNLVVARPSEEGATTSPLLVEGIIQFLFEHGCKNISIMEGSWVGDRTSTAYKVCGYEDISRKYHIPLIDLQRDQSKDIAVEEVTLQVCSQILEVDYLINLPVLKAHCQTLYTGALKNLKGCIPNSEKRRYHTMGLHKPIAYLAKALKVDLTIVDALNGDLTFEEGGNPVRMDRMIAGKDPVLVDTYCASLIGYTPSDIPYIKLAEKLGVGHTQLEHARVSEYQTDSKNASAFRASRQAAKLAQKIQAQDACSACYGGLIHALQRLEEKGKLHKMKDPLYIGQGFKNQVLNGIGIGNCASGCSKYVKGCPPKALDIVNLLDALHCV